MAPTTSFRLTALAAAVAMSAVTIVALAPNAAASGGGARVERSGNCTSASDWQPKVKADNGRLETEFEVDTNRNGQHWVYEITDNNVLVKRGTATTVAPSGSFSIHTLSANRVGSDRFVAAARNIGTGERCIGSLTF